jgi:YHS domain-containing protein
MRTGGRFLGTLILALGVAVGCAAREETAGGGAFYAREGVAIAGYDPVAYFLDGRPVKGLPEHRAEYKGSVFHFASRDHRDAFAAEPARFAPRYDGFCAFGVARGYKAKIDPAAFSIVDGRLYLNYDLEVREEWSRDIPGLVAKADRNWPRVEGQTRVIE